MRVSWSRKPAQQRRLLLAKRDGWGCVYCGFKGTLTIDHVIPRSKGGPDSKHNCVLACRPCNDDKADADKETFFHNRPQKP